MKSAMRSYKRNLGLIVLFGLIFAAAMGFYTYFYEQDVYVSSVNLYALPTGENADAQYNPQTSEMLVRDAAEMIRNPEIVYRTNEKLWPDELEGTRIVLDGIQGTHLIRIRAFGTDPSLCQRAVVAISVVLMEQMQNIANVETISVAERAKLPEEPVGPQRILKILAAFMGTFVLISIFWLLLAPKQSRMRMSDAEQIDWGAPILGGIADYRKDLAAFFKKKARVGESLAQYVSRSTVEDVKALSMALSREARGRTRSIVFASHQTDEGKGVLTALLAGELCEQGKRVLLVDMDCYTPTLARLFGARGNRDLVHYLGGEAALDQVILPTGIANLFVIDNLHPQPMASRVASTPAFAAFLERMYREFDYIFFDAPPVSMFADAAALGSVLEGTIVVTAQERLTKGQLSEMLAKLSKAGNHLCGLVFTFIKPARIRQYRDVGDSSRARISAAG